MGDMKRRIYLASSWRNEHQPRVLALLRGAGHEVYDFRNPQAVVPWPGFCVPHTARCSCNSCRRGDRVGWPMLMDPISAGFSWSEVDPDWQSWTPEEYIGGLRHPRAQQGFRADFDAMKWADTCVLLLPSGPSAALELGWCAGAGKRTVVHVAGLREPDLMYLVAEQFTTTDAALLAALEGPHE